MTAQTRNIVIALLFLQPRGYVAVGGQHHDHTAFSLRKIWYLSNRRLGEPQYRSRRVQKISPPLEFDPRTVHPVESRCTD